MEIIHSYGRWGHCQLLFDCGTIRLASGKKELKGEVVVNAAYLGVFGQHIHLFDGDETLEAVPGELNLLSGYDVRSRADPLDALCLREQSLHQGCLARQFELNGLVTETRRASVLLGLLQLLDGILGSLLVHELYIGFDGSGVYTLDDDMNGLLFIVQDFGVAAHDGQDLATAAALRNLGKRDG